MNFVTYSITDPRTGFVVYIGQTSRYAERQDEHRQACGFFTRTGIYGGRKGITDFLEQMRKEGHTPIFTEIERVATAEESKQSEKRWVRHYRSQGFRLLNYWGRTLPVGK